MQRIVLQPAFVLHRRPYGDSSQLLELWSGDHGRVGVIARGARSARSPLRGLLQPFTPLLASWSGRGELARLITAEATGAPISVPATRLLSGLYLNELLLRLTARHDPYPALFPAYRATLETLAGAAPEEPALRVFEKRLLAELGYGLRLDCEALDGKPILPERAYRYVLDRGPVAAERTDEGVMISGRGLLALHQETFEDRELWREIKRLTRAALGVQLRGRSLKTREIAHEQRQRP